ncbi:MAG: MarC family protein [Candidatus Eisenbacteria bacterium]|nr:MarC family protein [Candidatus Eisenbacteria bacterium]
MPFDSFLAMVVNLFLIIDPVGSIPLVAALTRGTPASRRRRMVARAVLIAFLVLGFFAIAGRPVLRYFGVQIPAVRIAGGVLLFFIGLEMLYGRISRTETTEGEELEAAGKEDISITPLAIPLLAGSLSGAGGSGPGGLLLLLAAIASVMAISLLLLCLTDPLIRLLGQIGIKVIARVMGLLLLFVATQYVLDGLLAAGVLRRP